MLGSVNRGALGAMLVPARLIHVLLGAIGGVCAVLFARYIADEVGIQPGSKAALVTGGTLVVVAMLRDMGILPFPVPSTAVQVPKEWRYTLPGLLWVALFGWLLGLTFLTRSSTAVVTISLFTAGFAFAAMLPPIIFGAVYGLVRTSIVLTGPGRQVSPGRFGINALAVSSSLLLAIVVAA